MSSVLDRAVNILQLLVPDGNHKEWGASEVARRAGIPVGTVHRILLELKKHGLVSQNNETKKFRLGLLLMELGFIAQANLSIVDLARPVLNQLVEKTLEATHLTIRDGYEGVLLDKLDSRHELRFVQPIGARTLLTQGALKKAILAFLPSAEIEAVLTKIEAVLQSRALSLPKVKIRQDLKNIKSRGYSLSYGEVNPGTVAIASPVFDYKGQVTASIGIMGPQNRFSGAEMEQKIRMVRKAGANLTQIIGGIDMLE
ncbi:MAG: IclR family transcriptional regulator [Firmicutes bacterium]|nr:IclR family transcriptional regulator [Bacillota bacterium]